MIEVENLTKRYGRHTAVDGISFRVHKGEILGFLGPNGAGKTTTVEILEGLLAPTAGVVELLGLSWTQHELGLRERIGVAHDADHVIAGHKVGFVGCRDHPAERLMAEDQAIVTVGRRAEFARDDLAIGAAHAERQRLHQHGAVRGRRLRDVVQPYRIRGLGKDRDGAQGKASSAAHGDDAFPARKFHAPFATSVMACPGHP